MGQNLTVPSPDDYDENDLSHWSRKDIEAINTKFQQQHANYAIDKATFEKLVKSQFAELTHTTVNKLWRPFESENELIYLSELLSGITVKSIGPLCDKVGLVDLKCLVKGATNSNII
jgi:hypothetical protein